MASCLSWLPLFGYQDYLGEGVGVFIKWYIHPAAKSLQSCSTLCDPIDGSPPGSPIPGILQARTLEWVAISFSNAWKWKVKVKSLSRVRLLATPWTAAYQAPPSMGFSRQEYWSGVPLLSLMRSWHLHKISMWDHILKSLGGSSWERCHWFVQSFIIYGELVLQRDRKCKYLSIIFA